MSCVVIALLLWTIFLSLSLWLVSRIARTSIGASPRDFKVVFAWKTSRISDTAHHSLPTHKGRPGADTNRLPDCTGDGDDEGEGKQIPWP